MDDPEGLDPSLAPLRPSDKPIFDRAFATLKQPISDYTFAGTFMWAGALKLYWTVRDSHVCVFANGTGDLTMLLPPLSLPGATDADLHACVNWCFVVMDRYNHGQTDRSRIEYVSDEMLERFSALDLRLSAAPMWADYVYETARMIDLAGGGLKSKRHARSRFIRDFPDHRTEPMHDGHTPACLELLQRWCARGDESHEGEVSDAHTSTDVLRHRDLLSTRLVLEHWREMGMTGMVLFVGNKLIGFCLGETLSPAQAVIVVEKTDPDYPGSAQFIFSEFCRLHWAAHPEVNVGDDWGIPSLRFTKQSYRPKRLLSKYVLTRQPAPAGAEVLDMPANRRHAVAAHPADPARPPPRPADGSVTLRRAGPDDACAILKIERACFSGPEEVFNRRQVRELIRNPRAEVTVAELDGHVAGWAVGLLRHHRTGLSGRLYGIAVHPEAAGRHIGQLLAERTVRALSERGIERTYLEVRQDNRPALGLYAKLGFTPLRPLPNYYGPGRHGLRMRLVAPVPATA